MGARKVVGKKLVVSGGRPRRSSQPSKKQSATAASGFRPLTSEGGEAEDDFDGPSVLDLHTEAALLAEQGVQQVEFLTGQLRAEEMSTDEQTAEGMPRRKRKKEPSAGVAAVGQAEESDAGPVEEPEIRSKEAKKRKKSRVDATSSHNENLFMKKGITLAAPEEAARRDNPRALPLPDPGADSMEQADWFAGCLRGHFGDTLSSLEQAEVTEQHVASGSGSGAPLAPSLKVLFGSQWQERLCSSRLEEGHEAGSPAVLIVSASAKRANDVIKTLGEFNGGCRVAKLFAKHFKVEEQVAMLKDRVNIAAGTPNRLLKLAELSALSLESLEVLVLDLHRDAKGLTVVDIKETRNDFWTLFHQQVAKRVFTGCCKLYCSL